ncbi:MAG: extracellular solute-binding protein, partial [Lachnospiraceae bacterium]|nr:extracellular solute-binding protein [Lachnospiraceae bacterium]
MTLSLVACGSSAPATETAPAATEEAAPAATEEAAPAATEEAAPAATEEATSDEPVTLTMWCIATEGHSNRHAYEQAIADMEEKYPNVTLEWEAIENEAYKTKIATAMADGTDLPDIFFTWSCAFLGDFVAQDRVYCLDDTLAKYSDELPESMLGNTTYDGKHYGV